MNHVSNHPITAKHIARLQDGGRVVIPADYRKALNIAVGEEMIVRLKDGEIHIYPARDALKRAREFFKKHPHSKNMADDLIADRRREAQLE